MTMDQFENLAAQRDWQNARRKVLYKEVVCLIKRCAVDLLSFNEVRDNLHAHQQRFLGLREIPLGKIDGSVGRYDDFDAAFMPRKDFLKERWQGVEMAMRAGKTPPIEVYQVGEDYFVVDGNHRVSVAHQLGLETIEAYVTLFSTAGDEEAGPQIDQQIIETERAEFLEKSGAGNAETASAIKFTCAGCYPVVAKQIEDYRQGVELLQNRKLSFEEAFSEWNQEVYAPSIEQINQNDLLDKFPDRTEADLFVWASQNSTDLEELEESETSEGS